MALDEGSPLHDIYHECPTCKDLKDALVKVEVGLCTGKKLFDKRETLKKKALKRDEDVSLKHRR